MDSINDQLALSRSAHDRDDAGRAAAQLNENARLLILHETRALASADRGTVCLQLEVPGSITANSTVLYLGKLTAARTNPDGRQDAAGTQVFAVSVDDTVASEIDADRANEWIDLREAGCELDAVDVGLFAEALGLRNFHASYPYSPATGQAVAAEKSGWVLRGGEGTASCFPRTDPAVIVTVVDGDDRLLLGANTKWRGERFSAFAGFVEPGESLEDAAKREVWEEAGARITNLRYLGSQPWPFPASLMVAFTAELAPDQSPADVHPDGVEIAEVRWFTRAELAQNVHLLPPPVAIARRMIEHWFGSELSETASESR